MHRARFVARDIPGGAIYQLRIVILEVIDKCLGKPGGLHLLYKRGEIGCYAHTPMHLKLLAVMLDGAIVLAGHQFHVKMPGSKAPLH
jgi:hypothetical protein